MVSFTYAENRSNSASPDDPRPLRVMFVSSRGSGGSGKSQRALTDALQHAGVEVMTLVDNTAGYSVTRYLHEQLWDASVRFENTPVIGGSATWLRSLPGRHPLQTTNDILLSPAPENAFPELANAFQPDVVVGSSLERPAWRQIRTTCQELDIPAVLYLRDKHELTHLQPGNGTHSGVLASSESLTRNAQDLGVDAHVVPPIVDVRNARTSSSRERVVLVDPRREHGLAVVRDLARAFPIIEFVLQEAAPLPRADRAVIDHLLAAHPNVGLRRRPASPADVFSDAAIILAPHQIDNRPRTILEAQSNGIPVIASDLPGMAEAVGPGGVIVPRSSGPTGWSDALATVWNDQAVYRDLERKARTFSARADAQPDQIVRTFLQRIGGMITDRNAVLS